MQKFNCLIVEDEPLAAEVLEDYINEVSFLELKAKCRDAFSAMAMLQQEKINLIFLDIHLPKLKGLEFIKTLNSSTHIIVTTAYQEYALQGYELNIIDYLLKPIEFNRFLMAVNKLKHSTEVATLLNTNPNPGEREHLFFNVNKRKAKIFLDEILYIESLKEYIRITTNNKSILTLFSLTDIEEMLTKNNFLRVHRYLLLPKIKLTPFHQLMLK